MENDDDLNPGFPPSAGRTPLAKVRNRLADLRSEFAVARTAMSRGRTGLAFLRTGIALITIAVTFIRMFETSSFLLVDIVLLAAGIAAILDGLHWYVPVRRSVSLHGTYSGELPGGGVSILEVENEQDTPRFARSQPVTGAEELRLGWNRLAPVERRRFLANDRTDLAEERTHLASLRTTMAQARMGLAFTRTGVAFAGIGIALLRKFPGGGWTWFDLALIAVGAVMALEGFHWYLPGYSAGRTGLHKFIKSLKEETIWDFAFPSMQLGRGSRPPVEAGHAPGIWGTTGLALERTVLAERRNLMSRLRTVMAHTRTGLAFIRTGISISAIGVGLLVFLDGSIGWIMFDAFLASWGILLVADGLRWYYLSERIRRGLPYCFGDFEIALPDYGVPARYWKKVVFSQSEL